MTHLWREGLSIKVWTEEGKPRQLIWNETVHRTATILNQWRIDRGWWQLRVYRDYFKVETSTGFLLEVYHDLMTDRWYVQRWYD